MIALDTNIIVHALVSSQVEHTRATQWLKVNRERLVTTGTNIEETLRLLTHPRVFPRPMRLEEALKLLEAFLSTYEIGHLEEDVTW